MFKKRYYVISGGLVLVTCLAIPVVKTNIAKVAFAQIEKETQSSNIIRHLKQEEYDSVIRLAEEYLKSNPNDITIIDALTEAYLNKGNLTRAETSVKRAIAIQSSDPWACRLLANIYRTKPETDPVVKTSNLTLALEQVERGLFSHPDNTMLLAEKAQIYSGQGDNDKAIQTIDRALSIAPNDTYLKNVKETINRVLEGKTPVQ